MAKFCTNTRVFVYMPCALLGKPVWAAIDTHVDAFMREILEVELLQDSPAVQRGIAQAQLGIGQGGIGMTSALLAAPVAQLTARAEFQL